MAPSWTAANKAAKILGTLEHDVVLQNGPTDSISEMAFSTQANHLAASSWDGLVRIYDLTASVAGRGVASIAFGQPVLSCHFSGNGGLVAGGGVDKTARVIDLGAGDGSAAAQQVAAHDESIKAVRFFDFPNSSDPMLATASWDKTIRYWDLRSASPAATLSLPNKIYAMDIKGHNLMAATADGKVYHVNLKYPTTLARVVDGGLKRQPRAITCMARHAGYGLAGVEGRVEIQYMDAAKADGNFTFQCHRDKSMPNKVDVYAVNSICEHPVLPHVYGTAGADGHFAFWNVSTRQRLKAFPSVGHSISASAFNRDGSMFAYAISYDWSKGYQGNTPEHPNKIMLHAVGDECTPDKK